MDSAKEIYGQLPSLETLSKEYIQQSKYILNAAIIEVLRDKNPDDVAKAKATIFEILESEEVIYDPIKYTLIDGRFLDGAAELAYLARRSPDLAPELYRQSGVLFAPFMALKAIQSFEQAETHDADLSHHHSQIARLYEKLGDEKSQARHEKLNAVFLKAHPEFKPNQLQDKKQSAVYASNVNVLPITLGRDGKSKFKSNLNLNLDS